MHPRAQITATAIITIAILEFIAIRHGIDGKVFALSVSLISGLAGYKIGDLKNLLK